MINLQSSESSSVAPSKDSLGCSAGCDRCPSAAFESESAVVAGSATAAAWVFLLPLIGAIVGAALAGGDDARQLLGCLTGFAGGIVLSAAITRLLHGRT